MGERAWERAYLLDVGVLRRAEAMADGIFEKGQLKFELTEVDFEARSILVIIKKNVAANLVFEGEGQRSQVALPPGYCDFHRAPKVIGSALKSIMAKAGKHIREIEGLPNKLIAVVGGIARYGLNNLAYIPGLGSLFQIYLYQTDLHHDMGSEMQEQLKVEVISPSEIDRSKGILMDYCLTCGKCAKACPTQAIGRREGNFRLNVGRCITAYNEKADRYLPDQQLPKWVKPGMKKTLYGCMACQEVCPMNLPLLKGVRECVTFGGEETKLIMAAKDVQSLPEGLRLKMKGLGMEGFMNVIPRNLKVIMEDCLGTSSESPFPGTILSLPKVKLPFEGAAANLSQGGDHQILFMHFEEDVELKAHAHEAQWGVVVSGSIDLVIGGVLRTYVRGDSYAIPAGVWHSGFIHAGYADVSYFNQKDRYRGV